MSEKFIIKSGKSPKGTIKVMGAKNATLPILTATLLTKEPCIVNNLPLIEDVFRMLKILEELGAEISWLEKRKIKIQCKDIDLEKLPREIIGKFRGSILLLGPLLARFGKIQIPPPGGCLIGARPLETHFDALTQLGVKIKYEKDCFFTFKKDDNFKASDQVSFKDNEKLGKEKGLEVIFRELSVTAAENVLMFSSLNPDKTILKITDQDYQTRDLMKVLNKMGAKIEDAGLYAVRMHGKKKLKGFEHTIIADPIETGTFIVLALATQGNIIIEDAELTYLELFLKRLRDFGAKFEILGKDSIRVFPSGTLKIDKIQSLPYPGIHTDLQPELGVLATQTEGPTLIHDPLYEGRLKYLEEINKMGAKIIFCDPHRAIVNGPTPLHGIDIPSPDLRAGAALIIAGLVAEGETTIKNIYQIDRGYESIEKRLQGLGLDIKRVEE